MFVWAAALFAQAASVLAQGVERAAEASYESGQLHGAILVSDGPDAVFREAYGDADREQGLPNAPELRFPIQSITKSFTAILILQLVEVGRISLDDTLAERLPAFACEAAGAITIHHLLCHQSGLPDYFERIPGYLERTPPGLSRAQAMRQVGEMELEFEPGTAFNYSNTNYVLLGMILERETGLPYAQIVEERVLRPLGMRSSRATTEPDRFTPLCFYTDGGETAAIPDAFFVGEGGIVSTLDDLVTFGSALGSPDLLRAESWKLAFAMHSSPANAHKPERASNAAPYGYGFQIIPWPVAGREQPMMLVGHLGLGYGSSCLLLRDVRDDRVLAYWNNVDLSPFNPMLIQAAFGE